MRLLELVPIKFSEGLLVFTFIVIANIVLLVQSLTTHDGQALLLYIGQGR